MLDITKSLKTRNGAYTVVKVIKKDNTDAIYPIIAELKRSDGRIITEEYTNDGLYNEDVPGHILDLVYDEPEIKKTKEHTMLDITKPLKTRDGHYKVKEIEISKEPLKHMDQTYDLWALLVAEDGEERNLSYTREGIYDITRGETELDLVYDEPETKPEVLTTFADDLNEIRTKISALDVLANEEFVRKLTRNDTVARYVITFLVDDISNCIRSLIDNTKNRG